MFEQNKDYNRFDRFVEGDSDEIPLPNMDLFKKFFLEEFDLDIESSYKKIMRKK